MPHGSGFDLLEKIGEPDFEVVFTTAYDQYGIQAVKAAAMDYLLKPIDLEELIELERKALKKVGEKKAAGQVGILLQNLYQQKKKIAFPTLQGLIFLETDNLVRLEADGAYTNVHGLKNQKLVVSRNLKHYQDILQPYGFFRAHKSHLINLRYVQEYTKGKMGILSMADGSEVKLSSNRREAFLELMR